MTKKLTKKQLKIFKNKYVGKEKDITFLRNPPPFNPEKSLVLTPKEKEEVIKQISK